MIPHEMWFNLPLKHNFNIYVKSYATMGVFCVPSYQWAATKKNEYFAEKFLAEPAENKGLSVVGIRRL